MFDWALRHADYGTIQIGLHRIRTMAFGALTNHPNKALTQEHEGSSRTDARGDLHITKLLPTHTCTVYRE
jgi:hypothetical protein